MKTLRKLIFGAVVAVGMAGPAAASPSLLVALPDITALTSEVALWIASEWEGLRKVLLSVPRAAKAERQAAVTIFEGPNHMIVEASRLPPDTSADAVLAQR